MLISNVWHLRGRDGEVLTIRGIEIDVACLSRFAGGVEVADGGLCWNWTRSVNTKGYGMTYVRDGRRKATVLTHRMSWILANQSAIPDGKMILHGCDNPKCSNPLHLRLGTAKDNAKDAIVRGRFRSPLNYGEPMPGSSNHNAKLTEEIVRSIRARYAAGGVTYEQIGREYGVCGVTIGIAVRGGSWSTVT